MIKQRIVTAVIAGLILLAILFVVPEMLARAIIALLMLIGAWEWSGFLGGSRAGAYAFVALIAAIIIPALIWPDLVVNRELVFKVAVAWWAVALVWIFFYPTAISKPVIWLCGVLVIVPAWLALDSLYQVNGGVLLFMISIVLAADTGAFIGGKMFGRVKLAPNISPGKTWEGVIGGLLGVSALVLVLSLIFRVSFAVLLPLSLAVGLISIVGDLTVSMFKRSSGVKDSGTLFPGHGGFLDRADSITAAAPLFALGLIMLNPAIPGLAS